MKKSTTLVSIVATAILTLASGSASAAPDARILQKNSDRTAPENCNTIWYISGHNIQDKGGIKCGLTKCRRYGLYITTHTWLGSDRSQYSCGGKDAARAQLKMDWSEHDGKYHTDNGIVLQVNSDYKTRIPKHYTERARTKSRGKAHKCSRSNQWWSVQGRRHYTSWRIGPAIC